MVAFQPFIQWQWWWFIPLLNITIEAITKPIIPVFGEQSYHQHIEWDIFWVLVISVQASFLSI